MLRGKNVSWEITNNTLKIKILKNIEPHQSFTGFFKKRRRDIGCLSKEH